MFSPDNFRVNETWIAFRANEEFLFVKDEPYDFYVLIDAASTYVFGHAVSRVVDERPLREDVEALFKSAWATKKAWAKRLIVTEDSPAEKAFIKEARKQGLIVENIPLSELEPIVGELKESFRRDFMGIED
ncbi:MAG: hypothetical protein GY846_13705 [Deltaproteobacteria bacterium]|nr:hypothetical protein [Deltaproteobacteria bacterium]